MVCGGEWVYAGGGCAAAGVRPGFALPSVIGRGCSTPLTVYRSPSGDEYTTCSLPRASRRFVICSVRPLILRVIVLCDTHWPLRPTASLTWLYARVFGDSRSPENMGPGPKREPKGDRVERPNGSPNGEREDELGNGLEKNGSSSSKKPR